MYKRKDSMIGLGRISRVPIRAPLRKLTNSAISRTMALAEGAIRQTRHGAFPDEAGSNSNAAWAPGPRKPQKWAAWTVVETKIATTHRARRQIAQLACRYWIFTVTYAA
jgi:hypothetical protein